MAPIPHSGATPQSQKISNSFCYAVEWYPESLPLENRYGSCMVDAANAVNEPRCQYGLPFKDDTPPPFAPSQDILIFPDSYGYCTGIVERAPKGRVGRKRIVSRRLSQLSQADVENLLKESWDLILFGWSIDPPASSSVTDVIRHQSEVSRLYFWILQEMQRNPDGCKSGLAVVTADCFADEAEIHEACGLGLITSATLFGMSNTARTELEVPIQYIETEWSLTDEMMPMLASEVFRQESFGRNTVRILKSGRYVLRQVVAQPYASAGKGEMELPAAGGIIAISGGNGSLAMVMGDWLLDVAQRSGKSGFEIKFLSRSTKVADDSLQKWTEIQNKAERLGIKVEQARCDVSKPEAVNSFIEQCTPNLAGFIHAAGVLRDSILANQTWQKFEEVFDGKSRAALYLHDALNKHENPGLKFFWMFSSTSVYGNPGQINYSGSNSFLDALARHRKALGLPGMTVQWGAWGEVGMAANLDAASRRRFQQGPMPPFSNREGLTGLEEGIATNLPYFSVFKYNAEVLFEGVAPAQVPVGQQIHAYRRTFTSNVAPLPDAQGVEDLYDFISSCQGRTNSASKSSGLVYGYFYSGDIDNDYDL